MAGETGDSLERHLEGWDNVLDNACEEFADFGFMDESDSDEAEDEYSLAPSNVKADSDTRPKQNPVSSSVITSETYSTGNAYQAQIQLTNSSNFTSSQSSSLNSSSHTMFSNNPFLPQEHTGNYYNPFDNMSSHNGYKSQDDRPTIDRSDSDAPLIQFDDDPNINFPKQLNLSTGVNNQNFSADSLPGESKLWSQSAEGLFRDGLPESNVSSSPELNLSRESLGGAGSSQEGANFSHGVATVSQPVRTVSSYAGNLDSFDMNIERTLEKLSSWTVDSQDSQTSNDEELGAVGGTPEGSTRPTGASAIQHLSPGGNTEPPIAMQESLNEKLTDTNLTIQADNIQKAGKLPEEPPPSYEEAMRSLPILHTSPQSVQTSPQSLQTSQPQHNRLSWQPPSQSYQPENRLSWQPANDFTQESPPPYQYQRPLSYHSQVSLGSMDSGRMLAYPPEGDAPGYVHHRDFYPEFNAGMADKFDILVARANSWLMGTPQARVVHCESMLYFSAYSLGFSPNRVISTKSKQYNEPTMAIRFLRIWYRLLELSLDENEVFPPHQISYRNFINSVDECSVHSLLKVANRVITQGLPGQILCVETLYTLAAVLQQPDICCWVERYQDKKAYAFMMRMFLLDDPEPATGCLGMMDFIPMPTDRSVPHDFEPFSSLINNLRNWLHTRETTHILNIQSFYVKWKPIKMDFWTRVHFSEGGMNQLLPHPTHYLTMLRVYYMSAPTLNTIRCGPNYQVTCKTFAPVQLTSPSDTELKFESLDQTVDRVKHWLKVADVEIICMETVTMMMYLRNHGIFGAEVTHTWTEMPNSTSQTYFLHCIRVYIAGEFHQPSTNELPSVPQVTPYYTTGPPRTISVQRAVMTFPPPPSPVKKRR